MKRAAAGGLIAAIVSLATAGAPAAETTSPLGSVLQQIAPGLVRVTSVGRDEEVGEPQTMEELVERIMTAGTDDRRVRGAGFVLSPEGEVVTAYHVVRGADRLRVRLGDDEEYEARVTGTDEKTDVAILRVNAPHPLPAVQTGAAEGLTVGDRVIAIANPLGVTPTASAGIVSAKGRLLAAGPFDDFILFDAASGAGSAGGPLVDHEGRVVGMVISSGGEGAIGGGFGVAVPMELVRWVIDQLHENGRVVRGWIGVSIQPVTPELARSFGLATAKGALVADVTSGSPAAKAGIKRGDVIMGWADRPIRRARDLRMEVAGTAPGTGLTLTLLRDGREETIEVTVREQPAERSAGKPRGRAVGEAAVSSWGLVVEAVPADEAKRLGLRAGTGLLVVEVDEASPAEDGGIEPGDVIVTCNRQTVHSQEDLARALGQNASHALLLVRRDTASIYVELER